MTLYFIILAFVLFYGELNAKFDEKLVNLALRRRVLHSSSINENQTGHLVTSGINRRLGQGNELAQALYDPLSGDCGPEKALSRAPRSWKLLGKLGNGEFVELDSQTNFAFSRKGSTQTTFNVSIHQPFSTFRLEIIKNNGDLSGENGGCFEIACLDLFDDIGQSIFTPLITNFINVDNNYWQSGNTDSSPSLNIDLGQISHINEIRIHWDAQYKAGNLIIDITNESAPEIDEKWINIFKSQNIDENMNNEEVDITSFERIQKTSVASGRFVRFRMEKDQSKQQQNIKIYQIEIFGLALNSNKECIDKNKEECKMKNAHNINEYDDGQVPFTPPALLGGRLLSQGRIQDLSSHKNQATQQQSCQWRLQRSSEVDVSGCQISKVNYDDSNWIQATVPGTVLVSFLNQGAIVNPNYGDWQLQISDWYFTEDFWYRGTFVIYDDEPNKNEKEEKFILKKKKRIFLNLDGINWKAQVYINGQPLNPIIEGAFIRAMYDITDIARVSHRNSNSDIGDNNNKKRIQNNYKPRINCIAIRIYKNKNPGTVAYIQLLSSQLTFDIQQPDTSTSELLYKRHQHDYCCVAQFLCDERSYILPYDSNRPPSNAGGVNGTYPSSSSFIL
ncbi:MAG: putative glycoside hydrolase, family 2, sugar binding domain protein [Streblomastix strix]|uniref:Putative glycoside hydrolase, family 2, sugar binding domain protein n=1 Tax=Streblomastix strix TaxID=222440 RepID=A0A5J4W2N8_9EUKA|nr:MAG: putative glycoside hydrolase, family 2, sugar binding domain protein [Streblomastix strix]